MIRLLPAVPLLAVALAACDGDTVVRCDVLPSVLRASASLPDGSHRLSLAPPVAVMVAVVDSVTGADLSAGASGTFVTGTFADSLRHYYDARLVAYGPPGRYGVVVQHPGYQSWGSDEVRVQGDECGLETAQLTARLRRAGT